MYLYGIIVIGCMIVNRALHYLIICIGLDP